MTSFETDFLKNPVFDYQVIGVEEAVSLILFSSVSGSVNESKVFVEHVFDDATDGHVVGLLVVAPVEDAGHAPKFAISVGTINR